MSDHPDAPPAGAVSTHVTSSGAPDRFGNIPAIEVELVTEVRRPPVVDKAWAMLEVWTQNNVYRVDLGMRCIEVVEIGSQKSLADHGLLGARLLGGQHVDADTTYLSHPYPRPGTEAVFEQSRPGGGVMFSHSSTVTRVVLRLRQLAIVTGGAEPTWDQIANAGRKSSLPDGPLPGASSGSEGA
jgi:hypothetical protein